LAGQCFFDLRFAPVVGDAAAAVVDVCAVAVLSAAAGATTFVILGCSIWQRAVPAGTCWNRGTVVVVTVPFVVVQVSVRVGGADVVPVVPVVGVVPVVPVVSVVGVVAPDVVFPPPPPPRAMNLQQRTTTGGAALVVVPVV